MNRLEWVLGIFLAILLLAVAGLSLMFWFQPSEPPSAPQNAGTSNLIDFSEASPTSVYEGKTAHLAYATAQETAVSWQPDAVLLNASGNWPHGITLQTLNNGTANWVFSFYSPATNKAASFSVLENNVTKIIEGTYQPQNDLVQAGSWNMDSNRAVQMFLAEGGESFIRKEGATTITASFTTDSPSQQIEWNIITFSPETGHLFSIQIDANSGQIITSDLIQ